MIIPLKARGTNKQTKITEGDVEEDEGQEVG
jgi:hypothetical protein